MAKFFKAAKKYDFSAIAMKELDVEIASVLLSASADFTSDGKMDILLAVSEFAPGRERSGATPGILVLLQGNGKGSFVDATWRLGADAAPNVFFRKLQLGDFNNDGVTDFVFAANNEDGRPIHDSSDMATEQIAYLSGGGRFHKVELGVSTWGHGLAVGDWNHDGLDDIVVSGLMEDSAGVAIQDGPGLAPVVPLDDRNSLALALADVDGDGEDEFIDFLAIYDNGMLSDSGLRVSEIGGDGTVLSEQFLPEPYVRIETGNSWNTTGQQFTIRADSKGKEYVDLGLHQLRWGDLNGDGREDLVTLRYGFAMLYIDGVLSQDGAKAVGELESYTLGPDGMVAMDAKLSGWEVDDYGIYDFKLLDWNSDGHLDIFVYRPNASRDAIKVYLNDGQANFSRIGQKLFPGADPNRTMTAEPIDANGDGIYDL